MSSNENTSTLDSDGIETGDTTVGDDTDTKSAPW